MIMIIDSNRSNTVIGLTNIFKNVYQKKKKKNRQFFIFIIKTMLKLF